MTNWRGNVWHRLWACIHILASQDAPRRCSKLASEGGSFESAVSIIVANLKRRSFRLLWYFPALCVGHIPGSYRLAINFRPARRAPCSSLPYNSERSVNLSIPISWIIFNTGFFPIPNNAEVESQPVMACIPGRPNRTTALETWKYCEWE